MKVIVFPFDNYVRPLIEYEKLWHFEICGLISPMGFGINNMQMYENDKKYIIKSEMSEDNMAEMEALLVVESYHFVKFELILEQINLAAKNGKNIVLARKIDKNEYSEVLDICEKSNVKLIEMPIESFKWEKNISGLQNINVPVIAIIENGVRCNAFEIEMQIISVLLKENYKVSLISSRQFGNTENIHAFPGFMNGNGLNESEKIICYNQYLKYIEENEKPEVIVVGIPGELLPLTKQKPGNFGIIAYEILNAVDPDFTILSLYKDEYKEEYFEEMNNLLHYRYNVDADCFYLCNCSIDRFSINSVLPIKYLEHKNEEIEAQCIQYVHSVYCKNTYLDMTDFLIETLTGYNEIQIF